MMRKLGRKSNREKSREKLSLLYNLLYKQTQDRLLRNIAQMICFVHEKRFAKKPSLDCSLYRKSEVLFTRKCVRLNNHASR